MMQTLPRLATATEVADQTGLSRHRVYELARVEGMPHVRLGRAVRFDPTAVRAWLAAGGTAADDDAVELG